MPLIVWPAAVGFWLTVLLSTLAGVWCLLAAPVLFVRLGWACRDR